MSLSTHDFSFFGFVGEGGGGNTSSPQNLKGPNCYFLIGKLSEKKRKDCQNQDESSKIMA